MNLPSRLDSCFHAFCFNCIIEWAKVNVVCPLCKAPFGSLIHSYNLNGSKFDRTYITKDILDQNPTISNSDAQFRKEIYIRKLSPIMTFPIKQLNFPFNIGHKNLAYWTQRELTFLLCSEGKETKESLKNQIQEEIAMVTHIISNLLNESISKNDFREKLKANLSGFLFNNTLQLIDELIVFLESPWNYTEDFDKNVKYIELLLDDGDDHDAVEVIESDEENNDDTNETTRHYNENILIDNNNNCHIISINPTNNNNNYQITESIIIDENESILIDDDDDVVEIIC
jgi:uncharacterized protein YuzE